MKRLTHYRARTVALPAADRRFAQELVALAALAILGLAQLNAAEPSQRDLERRFAGTVRPFVETYCLTCHGKEKPKGEFDLSPYTAMETVVRDQEHWKLVLEKLQAEEMPPKKAKQHPTAKARTEIIDWIQSLRKWDAARNAGDPGPVLARRLSNAEYDYSIHDLTGADIRPTKEFPVDPANQAGFDNSGESLTMSPALWKKYYQAARQVADHLVLQPEGFVFAPHPMLDDNDRDKYSVLRIIDFYLRQPTDYAEYFLAAWRFQHRAELGRPQATLADIATESKISAKYLATVWAALHDSNEQVGPIAKLQLAWRALPAPKDIEPETLRARVGQLRDWVLNLRDQLVPTVPNLSGGGFGGGSQPAVLWKDRQMAANRLRYDPARLRTGTPTVEPRLPDAGAALFPAVASASSGGVLAALDKAPTTGILPTPKVGQRLANGLGTPAAPVATTAADGRPLSALEIADLALAAQPVRKAGGPLPKTPDIIKYGGTFLVAPVVTSASSVTAQMARAKKRGTSLDPDLIVPADPVERARHEAAFARFAAIFPDAFFISERARVFQDAETEESLEGRLLSAGLHAQTGYFRDDGPLAGLILDDAGRRELDRLWDIFYFNAAVAPRMHRAFLSVEGGSLRGAGFEQFRPENKEAATLPMIKKLADLTFARLSNLSGPALEPARDFFARAAADNLWLEQTRAAAVPSHLKSLQDFAGRAWRRPLTENERDDLVAFYHESREANGLDHEDAMRDSITRVLMSPNFCYRIDLVEASGGAVKPKGATAAQPIAVRLKAGTQLLSDYALASRLSYFLWSSLPDAELLDHAAAGDLHRPEVLAAQAKRMLKDRRVKNLATEFAGNWLDFRRFEEHNAVDRQRFPSFDNALREAMFEEPVRFFVNVVQADRPVLDFLYADDTFVNAPLAKHYGIPLESGSTGRAATGEPTGSVHSASLSALPDGWFRVEHADQFGRGGLLPMAVFLTANSPGLRTSPVKRGYWVVRRVLGERIPPPPPDVPVLPADEKNLGALTLRETLAKHRENPVCAGCHAKFDSFGLVFEGYGAIGERREKDFAGHAVETGAEFPGGVNATGLAGLRDYVRAHREGDFIDNLNAKFLAYALGRGLQLSDDSLLAEMKTKLAASGNHFSSLVKTIVTSPQFRTKRAPAPATTQTAANRQAVAR